MKRKLAAFLLILAGAGALHWWLQGVTWTKFGVGRAVSEYELASSGADSMPGELSIRPFDEPFSVPSSGSSLFDKAFSVKNAQGVREYQVPYPFTKVIDRLKELSGGVAPQITLFPMGRSLQRSAAIEGLRDVHNLDPFYRFPRIVMGFDQDSFNSPNGIRLNFKERMYIGMNERSKLMEVISYNDEAGRFEYQVVRDYEAGKNPHVFYANRQLCLTCHQNQTPIFSRAPWTESNANPAMQEGLLRVLKGTFGDQPCAENPHQPFCFQDNESGRQYRYWGAPLIVDQQVPYALDQATKSGNYFHAYHKMFQRLCSDLSCRKDLLKQIFLYRLTDQQGLLQTTEVRDFNRNLREKWNQEFPHGLKLPEAAIPNRDPLLNQKDRGREDLSLIDGKQSHVKSGLEQVLANSDVPGEFEPLLPRPASEFWQSPMMEGGLISRLVFGYAGFFTNSDVRVIDDNLAARPVNPDLVETQISVCKVKKGANSAKPDYSINCVYGADQKGVQFSSYIRVVSNTADLIGTSRQLKLLFPSLRCDPQALATPENLAAGRACPQMANLFTRVQAQPNGMARLLFQTQSGLSVRLWDGRRLAPVTLPSLNPGEEKTVSLPFQLVRDTAPLLIALESAYQSGAFKKFVEGPALNRLSAMSMILSFLGTANDQMQTLTKEMQSLKKETEAPEDELRELPINPIERALALATRNCATCHFNREGIPPAFLGGPQESLGPQDKCSKLATCSARMLYRLKMWECAEADYKIKKTPMPPLSRLRAMGTDVEHWVGVDRKQLIESLQAVFPSAALVKHLMQVGISEGEAQSFVQELKNTSCPKAQSTMFEKLPRCDQDLRLDSAICN